MARLNPAEWRSVRTMWEASPNPGLVWLTRAGGGPWDVSAEALRRLRLREGWRKHHPAHGGADGGVGCWGTDPDVPGARGPCASVFALPHAPGMDPDDLRDALLERHRADWAAARRRPRGVQERPHAGRDAEGPPGLRAGGPWPRRRDARPRRDVAGATGGRRGRQVAEAR